MENVSPKISSATFHNGDRGRLNAWCFDFFERYTNYISRQHKQQALAGLEEEIGAGTCNDLMLPA